ncbi:hypothetical protein ACQKOF_13660 [Lysinibacillus sp. NPDC093190]|uniref:hypothetical protein n=1 Tax=Lysinibacillus sp. NPDC093190 TaxID=3390575 RepID=UPI003D06FE63
MKKVIGILLISAVLLVGGMSYFIKKDDIYITANELQSQMDEFIESKTVSYAFEQYGVHAVGGSGQEKVLTIRMDNEQHKEKVKKYFEKSLKDVGIDYKVEVWVDS